MAAIDRRLTLGRLRRLFMPRAELSSTFVAGARVPDPIYQLQATNAVMASAPTVTTGSSSTISGQVIDPRTDARLRWHGTRILSADATSAIVRGFANAEGAFDTSPAKYACVEFMADCSAIEFRMYNGGSAKAVLLVVDGYRHSATAASLNNSYIKFDFGGRKSDGTARRIQFIAQSSYFKEIRLTATDTLYPVQTRRAPKLCILGDSYATGYAADLESSVHDGYGQQLARLLGCEFWAHGALSNTGFVKTNAPYGNYASRAQSIIDAAPDVLIVQGSVNDDAYTAGDIGTAAASLFATLTAALPNAVRISTGILSARPTAAQTGDAAKNTAIQTAAAANGFTYIDTAAWISGTGKVSATTGDGNADIYVYNDAIHPTRAGSAYLASRLAGAIRSSVPSSVLPQ